MATRGELLTTEGWNKASGFFTIPQPPPTDNRIMVVSNFYGINLDSRDGNRAKVDMEYIDCGRIDLALRYSPAVRTRAYKTSFGYHLVPTPTYLAMYASDGKTLVEKKPTGSSIWQIEGKQAEGPPALPWTTVNTAIRYVIEARDKTKDPTIRNNADQTLTALMKLR
jgi:hypothetical protein